MKKINQDLYIEIKRDKHFRHVYAVFSGFWYNMKENDR